MLCRHNRSIFCQIFLLYFSSLWMIQIITTKIQKLLQLFMNGFLHKTIVSTIVTNILPMNQPIGSMKGDYKNLDAFVKPVTFGLQ